MRQAVYLAILVSLSSLAACSSGGSDPAANGGSGGEASAVTQTRMDDIDKIEGTISDEMIDTSSSTDDAPLAGVGVSSVPVTKPKAAAATEAAKSVPANNDSAGIEAAE